MVFKKSISVKNSEIGPVYAYDWEIKPIKDIVAVNESNLNSASDCKIIEYIDINSVEHGIIKERTTMYLKDAPTRAKRILKEGDVLISTVRPNLKHYCIIRNELHCTIASTGFAVLTSKNVDPAFLFYSITTETFTNYLSAIAETSTTAYPSITASVISESKIPYPRITEQKAIANILSSLDSKIELNQQMNKTLESIAQTLFKHWFIDFEFPDENGQPYKSSGGEMVDSELGSIPKNWEIKMLNQIAELKIGRTPPTAQKKWFSTNENDVPWVSIKDLGNAQTFVVDTGRYLTQGAVDQFNIPIIRSGTVVLSFKLTVGRVSITAMECISNEAIAQFKIKNQSLPTSYLYFHLKSYDFNKVGSTSSIANATNSKEIAKIPIIIPPRNILFPETASFDRILEKIKLNTLENRNLIKIRDFLLPRLISGKLRVPLEDPDV